ncbi:MAG: hypothetical protein AVDCRST_MAG07-833 [uncultured Frankineae bacterium]|uniref:DUF2877 domain-containing protein n=1 Tax=uncultured Frankineae bacterium TaxID=437475 RepID=A0A6J4KUS4_9ACTN|nr:MAG: hypothetical protein AVDCRST_MAG07-833 [uncultured Frankineae bacterium]
MGSAAVRPALAAPARGRVLGAFPSAVYVELERGGGDRDGDGEGGGEVVAVVTCDGLRLPNALVLAAASTAGPLAVHRAGQPARVRDGVLEVAGVRYPVARWRADAAAVPPGAAVGDDRLDELAGALPDPHVGPLSAALRTGSAQVSAALAALDVAAARRAADALMGLGPGLTPSGDDVLAGALVACARLRTTPGAAALAATADGLGEHVSRTARGRTCALSAALLRHAARGAAAPAVLDLVDALTGRPALRPALNALLAVGHTSGADTARGVLAAAQALCARARPAAPDLPEDR